MEDAQRSQIVEGGCDSRVDRKITLNGRGTFGQDEDSESPQESLRQGTSRGRGDSQVPPASPRVPSSHWAPSRDGENSSPEVSDPRKIGFTFYLDFFSPLSLCSCTSQFGFYSLWFYLSVSLYSVLLLILAISFSQVLLASIYAFPHKRWYYVDLVASHVFFFPIYFYFGILAMYVTM